ncbi:MAG: aminoglycoside phosphotransferase family protein [Oscillospiraceae bacterium]|nr:aminoglycoside phosphotransferase family protein [Oscillospiraceae bacterium]
MQNYPNITKLIKQDLQDISPKPIRNFRLIRAKSGVYVYRCLYDGIPAVIKYFEKEDDRREILNYRILARHGIPAIKTLALGKAALVMEDISISEDWRLGVSEDFADADVARSLAQWYFTFHENGSAVPELETLYFEYDRLTEENLKMLIQKLPEAEELFRFVLTHYDRLRELIYKPSFTLTYNDFYWTNFVVRNDKKAAMMFDYNLLGKGYRYSDFRNVCWGISDEARAAFVDEYNRLYFEKHGQTRTEAERVEQSIDDVAGPLFTLFVAFTEQENFPDWAEKYKNEAINGYLLSKAKQLLL